MSNDGENPPRGLMTRVKDRRHRYHEFRDRLITNPGLELAYRCAIAVVGTVVLVAGIVMIPYPGPGWLVVFTGLAILGSEFSWARRLLHQVRHQYDRLHDWIREQPVVLRLALIGLTGIVVLLTLWLLDVGGLLVRWTGITADWLHSPLGSYA